MSSRLLESMGLGGLDIAYVLIGIMAFLLILLIIVMVQICKLSKLKKRYEKFMCGKEAKSLEKEIVEKNKNDIRKLYKKLESAFQKFGLVKYDAFRQMGGQLSFSLALLDENNNGFLINSVHSTEGCYSYTKEIKQGECSISLSEEEVKALELAMGE